MRTFDGLRLHVAAYGPVDAPVTVVLAHCWASDAEDWHYQVRDLLARFGHGVRLLTWDHRGHGRSDAAPESACTIENLARDLGDVVDAHAPTGRLVVAGHSIGGMAVAALPEIRPDLIERIAGLLFVATSSGRLDTVTLGLPEVGPAVRDRLPFVLAARARLLTRRTRRRSPSLERAIVNKLLFGDRLRLRDAGLVVDQLVSCPPATMSGFFRAFKRYERTADLAAYDGIPTRVLVGDDDRFTPPPHSRRIASAVRGARLLVVPGAGHMLPLERDELVTEHLVELTETALAGS